MTGTCDNAINPETSGDPRPEQSEVGSETKNLGRRNAKIEWLIKLLTNIAQDSDASKEPRYHYQSVWAVLLLHEEYKQCLDKARLTADRKAKEAHKRKVDGQWYFAKDVGLKKRKRKPVAYAKRDRSGPRGIKGTTAFEVDEVDAILRKAYDQIYQGNVDDTQKLVEDYF